MNTDRIARTGTEAENGVTHYAGGTANAFARALAYEVGCGADVYMATYGAVFVEWKASGFRLAIEVDASGWFHVMQALDECREDYENMSLMRAADVARGWLDMFAPSHVNGDDYIRHLEASEPPVRVVESTLSPEQEAKAQAAVAKSMACTAAGGKLYTQEEAEAFVKLKRAERRLEAAERQVHRLIHGHEIESDRICDHELAYANLRHAVISAGLRPSELERNLTERLKDTPENGLARIAAFEAGWDGEDAPPPSPGAIANAREVIAMGKAAELADPDVDADVLGGVAVTYTLPGGERLWIACMNTGRVTATCHGRTGSP